MKRILLFVIVLILLVSCQRAEPMLDKSTPTASPTVIATTPVEESFPEESPDVYKQDLRKDYWSALDRLPDANQYFLDFVIASDLKQITAHETLQLTNRETVSLDELYFHLFPNYNGGTLQVEDVAVNQQPTMFEIQANNTVLMIQLANMLEPGEKLEVAINFTLDIPTEMGGNYGLFGYFDDVLVLDTFYPMLAVYDDSGWHANIPASSGDITYLDASFYQVQVTAPAELVIVSSGQQVSREISNGQQIITIEAGPARDFYMAASPAYQVWTETIGDIRVNSYALSGDAAGAQVALDAAVEAIRIFSDRLGEYPYKQFDVIGSPMMALGIEYPGITGIALSLYDTESDGTLKDRNILESVVVHEVGHQWFYNMVGNDQIDEPWLDESVVQYITSLYYVDRYGNAAAASYRSSWDSRWARVDRELVPIGMPASAYSPQNYSPIVYGRGPYFLAALETKMGKEPFAAFLKQYVSEYTWENSTTESFRQLAEETCSCDLGDLFAEWVYGP